MGKVFQRQFDFWFLAPVLFSALILLPIGTILAGVFSAGTHWAHIAQTVLLGYFGNTFLLVVLVSALALFFAVPTAWFISVYDFPGRRFFSWGLILPLAIPTYVAAFVYIQVPEELIPVLIWVRKNMGVSWFLWGEKCLRYGLLSIILAGVLYPYIYISARASFSQQRSSVIEAGQMLGRRSLSIFWNIALPLARPAIIGGLILVIMEVVNDYGAVHFFGVPTLTEGIFRTWFGLGDQASALRLAGIVLLCIFLFLFLERRHRGGGKVAEQHGNTKPLSRRKMRPLPALLVFLYCCVPFGLGFAFPVFQLIEWVIMSFGSSLLLENGFLQKITYSVSLALVTAIFLTSMAVFLAYAEKLHARHLVFRNIVRMASLGYAIPGAVIAISVMVVFGKIDTLSQGVGLSFLLSGSFLAIFFAYCVRFLAVAFHPVQAGMLRLCGSLDEASRMLGKSNTKTLFSIHLPLLENVCLATTLLVFIDILKELPLTMILRPANFETLATTAFSLAKEGRIQECALPSLVIVALSTLGLLVLNRVTKEMTQ